MKKSKKNELSQSQWKCTVCNEHFATRNTLYLHRSRNHSKEDLEKVIKPIETNKCDGCGKGHKTWDALRMHKKRCKGP